MSHLLKIGVCRVHDVRVAWGGRTPCSPRRRSNFVEVISSMIERGIYKFPSRQPFAAFALSPSVPFLSSQPSRGRGD